MNDKWQAKSSRRFFLCGLCLFEYLASSKHGARSTLASRPCDTRARVHELVGLPAPYTQGDREHRCNRSVVVREQRDILRNGAAAVLCGCGDADGRLCIEPRTAFGGRGRRGRLVAHGLH